MKQPVLQKHALVYYIDWTPPIPVCIKRRPHDLVCRVTPRLGLRLLEFLLLSYVTHHATSLLTAAALQLTADAPETDTIEAAVASLILAVR